MKRSFTESFEDAGRMLSGRRRFLRQLALVCGGTAAGLKLLPMFDGFSARAQMVQPGDERLETATITYPGADCEMKAYSAMPKGGAKMPGVIVIHENRGLNPHIEDVARRVALEGYIAIAPDALSPIGGTPDDPDSARGKIYGLDSEKTVQNYVAAVEYLKTHPQSTGKVGCMGFCWGGGMTNQVAVNAADLTAAVPFYGSQPAVEDVPKIKAAMLLHYASTDTRINAGIDAFEDALKKAGVEYTLYMYEGASHAFFNDSNPGRYHPEAAKLAWERTIAFFAEKLKAG